MAPSPRFCVVYSAHARRRMRKRGITEEEVERVALDPDATWPSGTRPNGVEARGRLPDGRVLHLCLQPEGGGVHLLVTAYWYVP